MGATEDLAALVAALLTAQTANNTPRVYEAGKVPSSPSYPYAVVTLSPDAPVVRDLGGSGDPVGRFSVQHFGRSQGSVLDMADVTFRTFDGKALPLPGSPVAEQQIATNVYRDPDTQGVLDVTHSYIY